MSNAASRASTASGHFREVQNTAAEPATMKLAQGLKELAEVVREVPSWLRCKTIRPLRVGRVGLEPTTNGL